MGNENQEYKIWPPYEAFYIETMKIVVDTAISHYETLNEIITDKNVFDQHHLQLIELSENIINQAAILSRYFWPIKKEKIHKLRGEKLREAFQVDDSNVLRNRDVRNFIEHFDENLDMFLTQFIAGQIFPKAIIFNSSEINEVTSIFRAYVVNEFKFIALNRQIEILPIVKEIYRIQNLIIDFRNNGGRLRIKT